MVWWGEGPLPERIRVRVNTEHWEVRDRCGRLNRLLAAGSIERMPEEDTSNARDKGTRHVRDWSYR